MDAADWLATDEGHAWIDATFPPPGHVDGFYQIKDDLNFHESGCAEARWLSEPDGMPAREGADMQNSPSL